VTFPIPQSELAEVRSAQRTARLDVRPCLRMERAWTRETSLHQQPGRGDDRHCGPLATFPNDNEALWPGRFVTVELEIGGRRTPPPRQWEASCQALTATTFTQSRPTMPPVASPSWSPARMDWPCLQRASCRGSASSVLIATGYDLTLTALIGVLLLIGSAKKNAIMMIELRPGRRVRRKDEPGRRGPPRLPAALPR
jgi:hypothetical protein